MADDKTLATLGDSIAKNLTFTPIKKSASPVKQSRAPIDPSIKKKTNDLVVDLHGIVQKWESLNQASFQTLNSLVSTCNQLQSSDEEVNFGKMTMISSECLRNYKVKLLKLRESLLKDQQSHMEQFEKLHSKMEAIIFNLEAIDLLSMVNTENTDINRDNVLFKFWNAHDFFLASRFILNCYTKEWMLKQELCDTLTKDCSQADPSSSSLFVSMWLQQPYLQEEAELKLETMILECGLK